MAPKIKYLIRRELIQDRKFKFVYVYMIFNRREKSWIRIDNPDDVKTLDSFSSDINHFVDWLVMKGYLSHTPIDSVKLNLLPPVKERLSSPVRVYLNPSSVCPFKCKTCQDGNSHWMTWTRETAFRLVREVAEMAVAYVKIGSDFNVVQEKGKPFFFEMAEMLTDNGALVSTTMIGMHVTPEIVERMKDLDIKVSISLDGDRALNERIRPGTYDLAVSALRLFGKLHYPAFVALTLSNDNTEPGEVKKLIEVAKMAGARGLKVRLVKPKGNAVSNGLMINVDKFLDGTLNRIVDLIYAAKEEDFSVDVEDIIALPESVEVGLFRAHPWKCGVVQHLGVMSDGSLATCVYLPPEYQPTMSIYEGRTLLDIWRTDPSFEKITSLPRNGFFCTTCVNQYKHHGGCYAVARYYGSIHPACYLHLERACRMPENVV